jgi:predicted phosphodiesterase
MRYAILSDVHSNLEALAAVLGAISELSVDQIVCLGDVVGYLADPNECLDLLRARGVRCIAGNHDLAAVGLKDPATFWSVARKAVEWTAAVLTVEHREYLAGLPRRLDVGDHFVAVHGTLAPVERPEDVYVETEQDAAASLAALAGHASGAPVCFFGHSHRAQAFRLARGVVERVAERPLVLAPDCRYLINPGSVGLPRDRSRQAAFLVYDVERRIVDLRRAAYDHAAPRRRARRLGLLQERLPVRIARGLARRGWRVMGRKAG